MVVMETAVGADSSIVPSEEAVAQLEIHSRS